MSKPIRLSINELNVVEGVIEALAEALKSEEESAVGTALVLSKLDGIEAKLDEILTNQKDQEKRMTDLATTIQTLTADVAAERSVVGSAVTMLNGITDRIQAAVRDALAANPSISEGDLAALTGLASDIEDQKNTLAAAVAANTPVAPTPADAQ